MMKYHTNKVINSIVNPTNTPIPYIKKTICKFSFIFLLDLNRIIRATPLLVSSPAMAPANGSIPFKYSSVRATLEAQLGIRPIKLAMNGTKDRKSVV